MLSSNDEYQDKPTVQYTGYHIRIIILYNLYSDILCIVVVTKSPTLENDMRTTEGLVLGALNASFHENFN